MTAVIVMEKIAQGVHRVVVNAVFEGRFRRRLQFLRIMVTLRSFDQTDASRRDDALAMPVSASQRSSDLLYAVKDAACSAKGAYAASQ